MAGPCCHGAPRGVRETAPWQGEGVGVGGGVGGKVGGVHVSLHSVTSPM